MHLSEQPDKNTSISIRLSSTAPAKTLQIPFSDLAEPCEHALFAAERDPRALDDEELPIHLLIYQSLLQLPVDARSLCMSRIIFVGGGSNIAGLKSRVLDELDDFIEKRGWNPVHGKAAEQFNNNPSLQRSKNRQQGPVAVPQTSGSASNPVRPAAFVEQEADPIDDQLKREALKGS